MTPLEYKRLYESEAFQKSCTAAGKASGVHYDKEKTVFCVFAVNAEKLEVCLYRTGTDEEAGAGACGVIEMQQVSPYIYEAVAEGDWEGVYYTYAVTRDGIRRECTDPYAKACGANGKRSMVVELTETNPAGWEQDEAFCANTADRVICELHIRDYSQQGLPGVREAYRGKYLAFTEKTGKLCGHAVGIPHWKRLGVTHVHLLPMFDYGSVDETHAEDAYNWGYDPVHYNVPEGSYATDPYDGHVRIRECKRMIQALHRAGIGVVMDVVYNHTYSADSSFQVLAPYYYYRQLEDGTLSDGSACGNETASERSGVNSFIRQSVLYWAKEYHLDGFRFDLMGLHDVQTMNQIRRDLDEAFPDKPVLLYGEPWTAAASPLKPPFYPAVKHNIDKLEDGIAIFNDNTRDAIKGSVFYGEVPGFVNGGENLESAIASAALAWCDGGHDFVPKSPAQTINYVSVHDNYTLWDKLCITAGRQDYKEPEAMLLRQNKLAAGIVFTCMGTPLFQAGEEFARTKQGEENTYCSSPDLNRLDWQRRLQFDELSEYYRGLIGLRRQIPFYRDRTAGALQQIRVLRADNGAVVLLIHQPRETGRGWKRIWICYYAGKEEAVLPLPDGSWRVLADAASAFRWKRRIPRRNELKTEIRIEAVSLTILGSRTEGKGGQRNGCIQTDGGSTDGSRSGCGGKGKGADLGCQPEKPDQHL